PSAQSHGVRKALDQARALQRPQPPWTPPNPGKAPALHGGARLSATSDSGSASGSMAGNYGHGATLSVNERDFELNLDAPLVGFTGISDGADLSIGLSYSTADAVSDLDSNTRRFGLPYGWKYNVSYGETLTTYTSFTIDG